MIKHTITCSLVFLLAVCTALPVVVVANSDQQNRAAIAHGSRSAFYRNCWDPRSWRGQYPYIRIANTTNTNFIVTLTDSPWFDLLAHTTITIPVRNFERLLLAPFPPSNDYSSLELQESPYDLTNMVKEDLISIEKSLEIDPYPELYVVIHIKNTKKSQIPTASITVKNNYEPYAI